ncbi:MAG: hypothetical protein P9L92_02220 [Candidatus Electryonea clarkiae]|nr:hypothetical protein [Candidatus Electryonea clarkiae]MDP8287324.1 hypothetical protein [Candidatus Electryonea clarkiae]
MNNCFAEEKIELVLVDTLHGLPSDLGQFGPVTALVFDPDGSLYALEETGRRIIHVSNDGRYLAQAGGFGFGEGAFHKPADITMVGFEIWVSDVLGGRIVRFDRYFAPLGIFGKTLNEDDYLPFDRPVSVAHSLSGDIIVIESDRNEALLIDDEGRLIDRFAEYGESEFGLISPSRAEISSSGIIAIADEGRGAVLLFDRFGSPRGIRPYPLPDKGPLGITWQDNNLWMCGVEGVAVFTPDNKSKVWSKETFPAPVLDIAAQGDRLAVAIGNSVKIYRVVTNDH